jgi:sortase (surface protein transpeptidase)
MRSIKPRRPGVQLLVALVLGLALALPVPSLAAAPTGGLTDGGDNAGSGLLHPSLRDYRAGERTTGHRPAIRGFIAVATIEAALAEQDAALAARIAAEQAAAKAAAEAAAKADAEKAAAVKAAGSAYAGTNHMWIPSLGMSRSVSGFACTRSEPPANRIYRWGCAGANNVYLFGHAWGVMKPLHDAYVSGHVKKGMVVVYADGKGRVRTYKVTEIRVVTPDQTSWAIAAQSKPSMTLQTCLGANSEKRLLVRLVATG